MSKILLLVLAFLGFTLINQSWFQGYRLDLTEARLYTLSSGTLEVIEDISEPIDFYYFFSESLSRDAVPLRGYAAQVEALLKEYELAANGKLRLHVIDPEPFSEQEDQAAEFGLQSVPVNAAGDEFYFGLAARNPQAQEVVIPFFQPDKEAFLEYDLSRTIQTLSKPELPKLALLSSLKINGDINLQTFQSTPPLMLMEQLNQRYEISLVDESETTIPEADLLVIVHPKNLSDAMLYEIDQFALRGGRLLIFVDPFAEMDVANSANPLLPGVPGEPSDLSKLMNHWGVTLEPDVIVADSDLGLSVGSSSGVPVRHIGILGLGPEQFDSEDIVISGVSSINVSSSGILNVSEPREDLEVTPLISVGPYGAPLPTIRMQTMSDPEELLTDFTPDGATHHLAYRLRGAMSSAFPGEQQSDAEHLEASKDFNAVIVADTDVLTDRLWVQVQNFFGQRIATPFSGNGDFVFNLVDNLAGSSSLIAIRSRGEYSRPFDVVADLRREAEAKYLNSAEELQAELLETEARLAELSTPADDNGLATVTPEQQAELLRFQEDKLRIRKQLRDVRHQLDKDIKDLGSTLKFVNILLLPLLLTLGLMALNLFRSGAMKQPAER